jgi:hypothetical protein
MSTSSPSQIASWCAVGLALIIGIPGAVAVARPLPTLGSVFKFSAPNTVEGRRITSSLARLCGIRDLCANLTLLAIWYRGDRELLGWSLLFATGVVVVDSWVTRLQLGRNEMSHWIATLCLGGTGAVLVGWLG